MGARNLELAHKRWGHLRGDAWRALAWMSLRAWDEGKQRNGDRPREFWAGYRNLAYGLGLISTEQGIDKKTGKSTFTHSHKERVRRAINKLQDENAITVLEVGDGRERTRVVLHLDLADVTHLRPSTPAHESSAGGALHADTPGGAYESSAGGALRLSAGGHSD